MAKKATATEGSHWGIFCVLRTQAFSALARISAQAQRAFTLIEIAIVLVVIGLITSGGLLAVSPVIQSAKLSETKQKMATVDSAILGYVITNGCLPCPAATGAGATGQTADAGGTALLAPCTTTTCFGTGEGLVPWVSLGLSENDVTDAWSHRLRYGVDPSRAVATFMQRNADGTFPAFASAITMENLAGADQLYTNIAYVVISHGVDGAFGETQTGAIGADKYTQGALTTGQGENGNAVVPLAYASGAVNNLETNAHFDDIVSFKAFQTLILSCGAGSCGNPS